MKSTVYPTNRSILIVENHDGFRQLIGTFLSNQYQVYGVKNGLEAFTWLNKGYLPDLIITDADTPEITGEQLLYQIRSSGMYGHIPVVVMSEKKQDAEKYFKALGASDYLSKPFNPFILRERLNQILLKS
jgi:CheY-like chemotaxis protein